MAGPVCSLLEAGRSELYAACYLFEGHESAGLLTYSSRQLGDNQLLAPRDLAQYLREQIAPQMSNAEEVQLSPYLFCGEISEDSRQALAESMAGRAFFVPAIASARRASVLASLAWQRVAEGSLDDPLLLEPLYLRRP